SCRYGECGWPSGLLVTTVGGGMRFPQRTGTGAGVSMARISQRRPRAGARNVTVRCPAVTGAKRTVPSVVGTPRNGPGPTRKHRVATSPIRRRTMSYTKPADLVVAMADAGETKIRMSAGDTIVK